VKWTAATKFHETARSGKLPAAFGLRLVTFASLGRRYSILLVWQELAAHRQAHAIAFLKLVADVEVELLRCGYTARCSGAGCHRSVMLERAQHLVRTQIPPALIHRRKHPLSAAPMEKSHPERNLYPEPRAVRV
jgi:hypothetical protein